MIADELFEDPRIREAKQLLLETVKEHQQKITQVKPAQKKERESYDKLLAEAKELRGGGLWYPYVGSGIGNGPLVELQDGSVKYDCINGIGVHLLGHSHPLLIEAGIDASLSNTIMQGNLQQNAETFELMKLLTKTSGKDHCFLTTSGVMANENGLKLAFQKKQPANRILAFEHCFAGRTWAFSQVTDKPNSREGLPANVFVDYIPFFDPAKPKESTKEAIRVLKRLLQRHPKDYAVMIFELIQGEGGIHVGTREFFLEIMNVLKEEGILIFADEVQTFGRTPALFATHYFGLEELVDIITIGKVSQVCATLYNDEIKPKPGLLSQTFTGSTSMIHASLALINHLVEGNYYGEKGKIKELENLFVKKIKRIKGCVGPYGLGTMLAFTPYEGDKKKVLDLSHRLFDAGVITFVTGQTPTRIRMLLSLATTEKDLDQIVKIIEREL